MIWFDNRVEGRFALASTADDHDACHDHVAAILGVVLFDEAAAEARAASRRYWAPGGEADRKYPQQPMPYWPPTPPAAADEDLAGRRRRRLR
jgi:hypothetical protein